ncbi:uncharacterized protein LOC144153308 [Haemaphysalis longicornis]
MAEVRFIPKPGKSPHIENLRPISLTSCIGKIMERIILKRLQNHLDATQQMPDTMFGFRKHLGTQDVLIQLKEEVLVPATRHSPRAILTLDLKGAFDNVAHEAILQNLAKTGCGERTYNYIVDFLSNRKAILKIGGVTSNPITLGSRGTPQGSVLSPLLFNIALLDLPEQLRRIPNLSHALYADDVTLWTGPDSLGGLQDTLQLAADAVNEYANRCGLSCSPQKSELLVVRRRRTNKDVDNIQITLDGHDIKPSKSIRILGLLIQADGKNNALVEQLTKTIEQVTHMVRRVTNRHRGMKESDTLRLIQAFVLSRITYVTPYVILSRTEQEKIDVLIRKSLKQALGLPMSASTDKLLRMGLHNTVSELVEGHLSNQRARLARTRTGRSVLTKLQWVPRDQPQSQAIPESWRKSIIVHPIPRNMHPNYHQGRREARAKTLNQIYSRVPTTTYTDAAHYNVKRAMVAVVTDGCKHLTSASIPRATAKETEELAIALALTQTNTTTIVTDSQEACRSFMSGWVSPVTLRILKSKTPDRKWVDCEAAREFEWRCHMAFAKMLGVNPQMCSSVEGEEAEEGAWASRTWQQEHAHVRGRPSVGIAQRLPFASEKPDVLAAWTRHRDRRKCHYISASEGPEPNRRRFSVKLLAIVFGVVLSVALAFAVGSRPSSPYSGVDAPHSSDAAAPKPDASFLKPAQREAAAESRQVAQGVAGNVPPDSAKLASAADHLVPEVGVPAQAKDAVTSKAHDQVPANAPQAGPLFCVLSSGTTHAGQIPRDSCSYIIYSNVLYMANEKKFRPVNDETFSALLLLGGTSSPQQEILVSIGGPTLDDLLASEPLLSAFTKSAASWLISRDLAGLAFIQYAATSQRVVQYAKPLQYMRSKFSDMDLKIVFGVSVMDWKSPAAVIGGRLAAVVGSADYVFLQTHYEKEEEKCQVALPSVYSSPTGNASATIPIAVALEWMKSLPPSQEGQGALCFSLSLAALLYRSHKGYTSNCEDVSHVSYMQICDQPPWPAVAGGNQSSLAYMGSDGDRVESHETANMLAVKVSRAVSQLPQACVAVFDVDRDDYEGVCGDPFSRLSAIRKAHSKSASAADAPVVLSGTTGAQRSVKNGYLAEVQKGGVRVLVALHERLLQQSSLAGTAEATAKQLREEKLDGLAFLYVSRSTRQLPTLARKMKELHDVYQSNKLCLLLSLQVVDYDKPALHTSAQLSTLNKHVDFLVLNTHYSGDYGPCRATPTSTFNRPLSSCIPQVPVILALNWIQNLTRDSSYLCFSVDMRAFAYHMYGHMVIDEECYSEEHLPYDKVCKNEDWSYKQDDYTLTHIGQLNNVIQSFETPATLKSKLAAASRSAAPCVAAFNYDYEDSSGHCHGTPYARMKTLRQLLDEAPTTSRGLARAEMRLAERSKNVSNTETNDTKELPSERPLVCVVSKHVEQEEAVPKEHCTHLVFSGATYHKEDRNIIVPKGTWRWREKRGDAALILGFEDESLLKYLSSLGSAAGLAFGMVTSRVLRQQRFDGLALLNINRTSRDIAKLSGPVAVIHELFGNDLQILVGLDILDVDVPPMLIAARLKPIFRYSHLVVFQTHFRKSPGYCEVALPSTFDVQGLSTAVPVETALRWLNHLGGGQQACFSVTMAVQQFLAANDGYICSETGLVNYVEACDKKNWVIVSQPRGTLSTLRQKGKVWQAFETEAQLAEKVNRAFRKHSGTCVALFNVDYENYASDCSPKFGRMRAVVQNYDQYSHQRPPPVKQRSPFVLPPNKTSSSNMKKRATSPSGVRHRVPPPGNLLSLRLSASSRPLLCVLSERWSDVADVPDTYCSHFVINIAHLDLNTGMTKDPLTLLKEKFGSTRKYLVQIPSLPLQNISRFGRELSTAILKLQFHGAALLNQHIPSPHLALFNERLLELRSILQGDLILAVGLEVPDFDEKPREVADRLEPLTRTADFLVLQTHYRRRWKFCRTAYPSIVERSNNTCQQSVPMFNALKWAQLMGAHTRVCLSVNLATLRFHYVDTPASGSYCTKSQEISNYCESDEWVESTETVDSMSASRQKEGVWDAYEEERLLKAKVHKVEAAYPQSCWAVFNVDYDKDTASCSVKRETFARLKTLGKAAGYKDQWAEEPTGTGSSNRARAAVHRYGTKPGSGGSIVCVFSGAIKEGILPPPGLCSAAIYTDISYDSTKNALHADDEDSLHRFATLSSHVRLVGAGLAAAVIATNEPFAIESTSWIRMKGLNTMAILTQRWPQPDVRRFIKQIRKVEQMSRALGKLYIILGIPPHRKITDLLFLQKEHVDMLIFMGHHKLGETPCHVMHPSGSSRTQSPLSALVETAKVMKTLSAPLRNATELCISLNLAVLTFTLASNTFKLGSKCLGETAVSYSEVCPSFGRPDIFYDSSLSCYKQNASHIQTFENEDTLKMKVEFLKKLLPSLCVATFYAEYEDSDGRCEKRAAFSRLVAIRESLDTEVQVPKPQETVTTEPPPPPTLPELPENLLCVLSEASLGLDSLPPGLCTHVIFTGLYFSREAKSVVPRNASAFDAFLKLKNHARLYAGLSMNDLSTFREPSNVEHFSRFVCSWLMKNELQGLAMIETANRNFDQAYGITKALRWQFMSSKANHLQLIFAAPIHTISPTVIKIADFVNFLVFIRHTAMYESCEPPTLLANQYGKRDLVETIQLLRKLSSELKSSVYCVSLNLAVARLSSVKVKKKLAMIPCSNKTLTTYDKVCSQTEGKVVLGSDFSGMYLQNVNDTLHFETEESLLEKVHTAKSLYPLKCIAALYADYEDFNGTCETKAPFSRLKQISKALGYRETKAERVLPLNHPPQSSSAKRPLVCMITQYYPDFDKFPSEYCDYMVYTNTQAKIRRKSYEGFSDETFNTFLRHGAQQKLRPVIGYVVTSTNWELELADSYVFAKELGSWIREKSLEGVAFVLPAITDDLAEHLLVLVNLLKKNASGIVVVAAPVTEKPAAMIPFAEIVDMLIFMTHRKSPESPCRISLPSSRTVIQDENSELAASSLFMNAFGDMSHRALTCFSLNFATLKFAIMDNKTEFGAPCLKEIWVNYYETCPRSGVREGYFSGFKTMAQFSNHELWTFEDEHTVSWKLLSYLQSNPSTCVAAFYLDYEDRRGVCRQPYSRLARLSNALATLSTAEESKGFDVAEKPGTAGGPGKLLRFSALESQESTEDSKNETTGDAERSGAVKKKGSLACIVSSLPDGFPLDMCTHLIFSDISYDTTKNVIKTTKVDDLLAFLRATRRSSAVIAVSINVVENGLVENGLVDSFNKSISRKFAQRLSAWLNEHAVPGAALFSSPHGNIKAYDRLARGIWRHFQGRSTWKLKLILGVYFEHFKSAKSMESLSRNADLVLLLTHRIVPPNRCNVEYPSLYRFTESDYDFLKSVCDAANCSVCLSLNLAVTTSAVLNSKSQFGDHCRQQAIEGYDKTCRSFMALKRDHQYDIALKRNASHLQAFEDETSLTNKVTSFFRALPTRCVAAFRADLDDVSGKCSGQPKYARLRTLARLVGAAPDDLEENRDSEGRIGGEGIEGGPRRPFVCVFRGRHIPAKFPENLCTHLVYLSVAYDLRRRQLHEGGDFQSFMRLRGSAAAIAAVDSVVVNTLDAGNHENVDHFLQTTSSFVERRGLDGLAMISTLVMDMENFAALAKRIWSHFQSGSKRKFELILGVQLQAINERLIDNLSNSSDILIFINLPMAENPACKVSRPSNIPITKLHRLIMKKVGENPLGKPIPCISLSMAVHNYKLRSPHARFMDSCARSNWVNYKQTCPSSKPGTIKREDEGGAAYLKENMTMLVFEDEITIAGKVASFLDVCPSGGAAVFHVEYEDFIGQCSVREKYSRLQSVARVLEKVKYPGRKHHKPAAREECLNDGRNPECRKRELICVVSSDDSNSAKLGGLCSHVVFAEATYDDKSGVLSLPEHSFKAFLSIEGTKRLVALAPSIIEMNALKTNPGNDVVSAVAKLLNIHPELEGIALFSTEDTEADTLTKLALKIKNRLRKIYSKKILMVGLQLKDAPVQLHRLQGKCDIIVVMTHGYKKPEECRVSGPTAHMLSSDDFLRMRKVSEDTHERTKTCVSINLATRSFKLYAYGKSNQDCDSETWSDYAQVCPSKGTSFHNFKNISTYWKNGSSITVFESEATVTDKVSYLLALHPKGCVALFGADEDDLGGRCRSREPAPRVQVARRLLYYAPMTAMERRQREPSGGSSDRSATESALVCAFAPRRGTLEAAREHCSHLVYLDMQYDSRGRFHPKNRASFEEFKASKADEQKVLFVGMRPSVIEHLVTNSQQEAFAKHARAFLDQTGLDGLALFTSASTNPGQLQKVAAATVKNLREETRPRRLLLLAAHVGIKANFEKLMNVSDILVLEAHPYGPEKHCKVASPSETPLTEKMFELSKNLLAKAMMEQAMPACISINLAVRRFKLGHRKREPGSKCKYEHWANYAEACPDVHVPIQRARQNEAAYQKNGTVLAALEDEESVAIKVLRHLQDNPVPCVAAFRVDAEDTSSACAARERASRLRTMARLLSPGSGFKEPVKNTPVRIPKATESQKSAAVLCTTAMKEFNIKYVKHLCTHIIFLHPVHKPHASAKDNQPEPKLLLSGGTQERFEKFDSTFATEVLETVTSRQMDGRAFFLGPQEDMAACVKNIKSVREAFDGWASNRKLTVVVGAPRAALDEVLPELGKYSNYIVIMPNRIRPPARCTIDSSPYFALDDIASLNTRLSEHEVTAMLAVPVFLPVVDYKLSKKEGTSGRSCKKELWRGFAVACFNYGFDKEERAAGKPVHVISSSEEMFYEDEKTIADKITKLQSINRNISVAAFYIDTEDVVGTCVNKRPASRLSTIYQLITRRTVEDNLKTPKPRPKSQKKGAASSLVCVYSHVIPNPHLLIEVCDYIVFLDRVRGTSIFEGLAYDQLWALDRGAVSGLLLGINPHRVSSLLTADHSAVVDYLEEVKDIIVMAKLTGFAVFFPDIPLADAYVLQKKVWNFFSKSTSRVTLLAGVTSASDLQELQKVARKCDILVLVKHQYTPPSDCRVTNPLLKPIEEQDYASLASLAETSGGNAVPCLSLPMAVTEYKLSSARTPAVGAPCESERTLTYDVTCPNPNAEIEYDHDFTRCTLVNGTTMYTFQDERVVGEMANKFHHKIPQGCIAAFYVEYEDWTCDICTARQAVARLKAIATRLNTYDESPTTTPPTAPSTSVTPLPKGARRDYGIICLYSRPLANVSLVTALCPYLAYMGIVHDPANDRFYIDDSDGLYQFISVHPGTTGLIIATEPIHSHLWPRLYETFLGDLMDRLSNSISGNRPQRTTILRGAMIITTALNDLDSVYEASLKLQDTLHAKHQLYFLAVQTVGYSSSLTPFNKLKRTCDQLILFTNPYTPSPNCKISPTMYQEVNKLDRKFFEPMGEEYAPCITLNMAVRSYSLADGKSDFGQDCASETWKNYGDICHKGHGGQQYTAGSAFFKDDDVMYVYEDKTTIAEKLTEITQINPNICLLVTEVEREDWSGKCASPAPRMHEIAGHFANGTITRRPFIPSARFLVCIVDRVRVIKGLPKRLCTHLVYASVKYEATKDQNTYRARDSYAYKAASKFARKTKTPFLSEVDMSSFVNIDMEYEFKAFLKSSTQWMEQTRQDGLAFFNVQVALPRSKFAAIVKATWEYISQPYTDFMLVLGLDYKAEGGAELAKELAGKCTLMVFLADSRKTCCHHPCKVPQSLTAQIDEDTILMKDVAEGSRGITTPCLSFSLQVRMFNGAREDGTCSKEEWADYTKVCEMKLMNDADKTGKHSKGGKVYVFEDEVTIEERVSHLSGNVRTLCAAAFNLDMDDVRGNCSFGSNPFPRLSAIQKALEVKPGPEVKTTSTGPKRTTKAYEETSKSSTTKTTESAEATSTRSAEIGKPKTTPPGEQTGVLVCVLNEVHVVQVLPENLCTHVVYSRIYFSRDKTTNGYSYRATNRDTFNAAFNFTSKRGIPLIGEIDVKVFSKRNAELPLQDFVDTCTKWIKEAQIQGLAFIHVPTVLSGNKFEEIVKRLI